MNTDSDINSRLVDATKECQVNVVRNLLEQGANPDHKFGPRRRPLLLEAARRNNADITRLLLDHGAQPDAADLQDITSLYCASAGGYLGIVRMLLAAGADANRAESGTDITPIMPAAGAKDAEVIRELIRYGANVDHQSLHGTTALMFAVYLESADRMQLLLDLGADPTLSDREGDTVLDTAISLEDEASIEILRSATEAWLKP